MSGRSLWLVTALVCAVLLGCSPAVQQSEEFQIALRDGEPCQVLWAIRAETETAASVVADMDRELRRLGCTDERMLPRVPTVPFR